MSRKDATKKNQVAIDSSGTQVVKVFTQGRNKTSRFYKEVNALKRLTGIAGIPEVLSYSPSQRRITVERIAGTPLPQASNVPDDAFIHLRIVVEDMLYCGVARHSLPARDVIVCTDGSVGVVDYERCSFRGWRFDPLWWVAAKVARFNLLRLIHQYAPHLLTEAEYHLLRRQYRIQTIFHLFKHR